MLKKFLTGGAALTVLAMTATGALAQINAGRGGGAAAAPAAPAAAAPAMPSGGGAANVGGGRMGGGGMGAGRGAAVASGPINAPGGSVINPGPRPGPGWSGPRPGWHGHGHRHRHRHHHHHAFGPSFFFGSTYAASPYYYDDYYDPYVYEDVPYAVSAASPEDVAYCRQKYRSYDIRTGTYLAKSGRRLPCP